MFSNKDKQMHWAREREKEWVSEWGKESDDKEREKRKIMG